MKENQRVKVTKRMLKDSLLQLLKEKDLDEITVTELCARAQINRTTFYRYYNLPADVLNEMGKDLAADMAESLNGIKTVADAKAYLKGVCESCHDNSGIVGYFLHYESDHSHAEIFRDLYKNSGIAGGETTEETEYNRIVATYFAGGAYFILRLWYEGGIDRTSEEMASLLWELMTGDYSVIAKSLK